ncbi:serine/threonine-protein kinase [Planctomycetota bacterium]
MAKAKRKRSPYRRRRLDLKAGRRLGKYRLDKRLGEGGSCEVWRARDCVEDIAVALKIPLIGINGHRDNHQLFREIRLVSRLRHPSILRVKNADVIEDHVVLATEVSYGTLDDRSRPMAPRRLLIIIQQVLDGLAHAHRQKVVHCDVTPMNIFLFPNDVAALGDFGISLRIQGRMSTVEDFGTPGYVAPEQAYGRPTYSSDCFAAALILYEYLTGVLPRWPFRWPLRGYQRVRDKTSLAFAGFLKHALSVDPSARFANAGEMLDALQDATPQRLRGSGESKRTSTVHGHWLQARRSAYLKRYSQVLGVGHRCVDCGEPVVESMALCPWCGSDRNRFEQTTALTHYCGRCSRGMLGEWSYCPWCHGPGYEPTRNTATPGVRYQGACKHCHGKLMRFMRYCPWCKRKVQTAWESARFPEICGQCQGPVDREYWHYCPWCRVGLW